MSVRKLIHKALSDSDIRTILGVATKSIKYSELANISSLDELLKTSKLFGGLARGLFR